MVTQDSRGKRVFIHFLLIVSMMVIVQGCNTKQKNIDKAVEKVADLFEVDNKEEIKEGKTSKIKDSTNKEKITAALEAINKIDTSGKKKSESEGIVFALHSAVLVAQMQLSEGESIEYFPDNDEEEEEIEQYEPEDTDIMWQDKELQNKDVLEAFMDDAGGNGKDLGSEIRVVQDEGEKGVIIYDVKSIYDENVDQGWLEVNPDVSYYVASEDEGQEVFHMGQQCSHISKDKERGYYLFNECFTHMEYPFLPITADQEGRR